MAFDKLHSTLRNPHFMTAKRHEWETILDKLHSTLQDSHSIITSKRHHRAHRTISTHLHRKVIARKRWKKVSNSRRQSVHEKATASSTPEYHRSRQSSKEEKSKQTNKQRPKRQTKREKERRRKPVTLLPLPVSVLPTQPNPTRIFYRSA